MPSQQTIARMLVRLLGVAMLVPASFFGLVWYVYYWRHRECIEEAWRAGANGCFVPEDGVNYSGSSGVAIWPALACLVLAIGLWFLASKIRISGSVSRK